jgi:hypothetical protein
MTESPDRHATQAAFAAFLRDPASQPSPPGVELRRMAIYRELFFNNVRGLLSTAFPVLRRLHDDSRWDALVGDFFREHRARSPIFHRLAGEFVDWLTDVRGPRPGDLPFLAPLAHYEWVELVLATAEDPPAAALLVNPHGDLVEGVPRVSPLSWTLAYDWPVHRIGPDFQPAATDGTQTFLVVHRNRDDEVKFVEINAVTARLLTLAEESPSRTGADLLMQIAEELQHADLDAVIAAGAEILDGLRERGIVLGTRRHPG